MPPLVWLSLSAVALATIPIVYYSFVMVRSLVRARKEAHALAAGHRMPAEDGSRTEAVEAKAEAPEKVQQPEPEREDLEALEIEKAIAALEGKGGKASDG